MTLVYIFYSDKDVNQIERVVNKELGLVAQWLSANKLSLNVTKSSFIIFHPPQKRVKKINIKINLNDIPERKNTKYLGIIMDKHLTWKEHIHYLNIKLTRALGIISKLRYNVPQHLLITIYSAFFKPHIEYCVNIWSCTCNTNLQPINVSMKKAIRLITFSKFDAHTDPLYKSLNILNLSNTLDLYLGKFMWEVNNTGLPKCLMQILNFNKEKVL